MKKTFIIAQIITLLLFSYLSIASPEHLSNEQKKKQESCGGSGFPYKDVVNVSKKLVKAVKANDIDSLSKLISYPLEVYYTDNNEDTKSLVIHNKTGLLSHYNFIFNKKQKMQL